MVASSPARPQRGCNKNKIDKKYKENSLYICLVTKNQKWYRKSDYEFLTMMQEIKKTNEFLVNKVEILSKKLKETSGNASDGKKPFSGDSNKASQESVNPVLV